MTAVVPMPQAVYDAHSAQLAAMVDAILDRPDWLKRWRLLAIYEAGGSGALLGYVLETRDGAVLVGRITNADAAGTDSPGEDLRQNKARLLQPITGDPDQKFTLASRRTQYLVNADYLITAINSGKHKVALRPGWTR